MELKKVKGRMTDIEILGTESLGVRGLCCVIRTGERCIVIDPGVALGYKRRGRLPHPIQVAVCEEVRKRIVTVVGEATDIILSHFHGDHVPMPGANPYQLDIHDVADQMDDLQLWCKGPEHLSPNMARRRKAISRILERELPVSEGTGDGVLTFSKALPHGEPRRDGPRIMMTRVATEDRVIVHASDSQLLHGPSIDHVIDWEPDIVIVSGPPLYLPWLGTGLRARAWANATRLMKGVEKVIIDHHLLRSVGGLRWLRDLASTTGGDVGCAADHMGVRPMLLEAKRDMLYEKAPVPDDWHERYAEGRTGTDGFRDLGMDPG